MDLVGFDPQLTTALYTSLQFDTYTAREHAPIQGNWYSTAPTPVDMGSGILNKRAVTVSSGSPNATVTFGNVCTGAGGGHTLGFWSNKNGQATMTTYNMANQLAHLRTLNLVNPSGSEFNPTDYASFRKWLLSGNAVNMSLAGVPQRAYQGLLKTALDRANNNLTFVQNQPCAYTFAQ